MYHTLIIGETNMWYSKKKRPEVVPNLSTSVASITGDLIARIGSLNGTEACIGSG